MNKVESIRNQILNRDLRFRILIAGVLLSVLAVTSSSCDLDGGDVRPPYMEVYR